MELGCGVQQPGAPQRSECSRVSWARWPGFAGWCTWGIAVAVVVVACAASVTALAASSYSVRVSASSPVAAGHSFSVKARGGALHKALLYVYLDRKACRATWDGEAQRVNRATYKSGQSYFLHRGGGPPEAFNYAWVSGSFEKSFTAHAGTTNEPEHACAYVTTPNRYGGYQITAAHGSVGYTVTQ